jgi:hypothetical protein
MSPTSGETEPTIEGTTPMIKAHHLINSPDKWTQGVYARDARDPNQTIDLLSEFANCFCVSGAIRRKHNLSGGKTMNIAARIDFERIAWCCGLPYKSGLEGAIIGWNDSSDWETVYSTLVKLDI